MSVRDREVILKMIKYCNDVEQLMEKYNSDFEAYKTDISFQYSCNMCIIQIGELVSRLSEDFLEKHSQIPWYAIKGMRNLHAHDYEKVDLNIVWNTLTEDIPDLLNKLDVILNE
jgi:uncharacterized protein with HEPN domain